MFIQDLCGTVVVFVPSYSILLYLCLMIKTSVNTTKKIPEESFYPFHQTIIYLLLMSCTIFRIHKERSR